jgi:hypothetical protein
MLSLTYFKGMSMNKLATVSALIVAAQAVSLPTVWAYSEPTHQIMSQLALQRSDAGRNAAIYDLLGITYPDAWSEIGTGAIDEDGGIRPLNHFYNPRSGEGLLAAGASPSPAWILERQGDCEPVSDRFSLSEAQVCFIRALTNPNKELRQRFARRMFATLGHVVHHVQDMAQPQHTRLDEHCDSEVCKSLPSKAGGVLRFDPSGYEDYSRMRQSQIAGLAQLPVVYSKANPNPIFALPLDFWKNSNQPGQGLAEFSSENFTTTRTNFVKCTTNPRGYCAPTRAGLPAPNLQNTKDALFASPGAKAPSSYVTNSLGVPMGRISRGLAEADDLVQDIVVFDQYFKTLVPKALAYSIGLINYHFRGEVNAEKSGTGTVVLSNLSPENIDGDFILSYDTANGVRQPAFSWKGKIAKGEKVDTGIAVPSVAAVPKDQFILAFTGAIGANLNQVAGKKVSLALSVSPGVISQKSFWFADSRTIPCAERCRYQKLQYILFQCLTIVDCPTTVRMEYLISTYSWDGISFVSLPTRSESEVLTLGYGPDDLFKPPNWSNSRQYATEDVTGTHVSGNISDVSFVVGGIKNTNLPTVANYSVVTYKIFDSAGNVLKEGIFGRRNTVAQETCPSSNYVDCFRFAYDDATP